MRSAELNKNFMAIHLTSCGYYRHAGIFFLLISYMLNCQAAPRASVQRYVDPVASNAADMGEGDARHPYKTLSFAIQRLQPGDTLNIKTGIYRESLIFPKREWKNLITTVRADNGAKVLIKGSDVIENLESLGNNLYVKRNWNINSQQVFLDGMPLKQIGGSILNDFPNNQKHPFSKLHLSNGGIWPGRISGGIHELTVNSFYYDKAAKNLYIKAPYASLTKHILEVSVRPFLIKGDEVSGIKVSNISLEHSNTTSENMSGAISMTGNDLSFDRIEVTNTDGNCIDITGDRNQVINSKFNYCGIVGLKARGRQNKLFNNETSYNNTRGFNKWWEAGGAKFVGNGGLIDSEVAGHKAFFNNADGIWFDWLNNNNLIHDNISAYNNGFGIHYESSQKALIYNNIVYGNKQRGIYLPQSSDIFVFHNLIVKNDLEGIVAIDQGLRDPKNRADLTPRANKIMANVIAWHIKPAVILPEKNVDNISDSNVILLSRPGPVFGLGWGSLHRPLVANLKIWQSISGQDTNSKMQIFNDRILDEAITARKTNIDWTPMLALMDDMQLSGVNSDLIKEVLPKEKNYRSIFSGRHR